MSSLYKSPLTNLQPKEDEILYKGIEPPDMDILKAYLEGSDETGKPYFSHSEKMNFIRKWKEKNAVREEEIREDDDGSAMANVMPAYSMSPFGDKKRDPNSVELERLLSMIKNERMRNQIAREADVWSGKTSQPAFKYVEKYLINGGHIAESVEPVKEQVMVLELNQLNKQLDESFLRTFGGMIEKLLQRMFGMSSLPVKIRGNKSQIDALQTALSGEKRYMDMMKMYGKESPHTARNKSSLEQAISQFERKTGLKWPLGDKK